DLPRQLLKRLRSMDQFQGARYEIGIAAIFARLGFSIEFLDERTAPDQKHCEFNLRDSRDELVVAVEVKSRHRPGVLHERGVVDENKVGRGDVARLIREAKSQSPGDKPFLVFIDLNAPLSGDSGKVQEGWYRDVQEILRR